MSAMVGANAEELDRLATRMLAASTAVGLLSRTIGVALRAAPWFGGAADVFRQSWGAQHARALAEASEFLQTNADTLRLNAQQQRDASTSGGVRGTASPGSGPAGLADAIRRLNGAGSPDDVASVWESLTPDQQRKLIEDHPDLIGNLDGVPVPARIEANRIRVKRDLDELVATGDSSSRRYKILEYLNTDDQSIDPTTGRPRGLPQIYLYDGSGDGRVAVVDGDLETAQNVAVYVPGTGAGLDGAKGDLDRGRGLHLISGPNSAVVTWIGYDAPDAVLPTQNGQPIGMWGGDNAMLEKFADKGSQQLATSLEGLGVARNKNFTVIAHSYGALVAAHAVHKFAKADNLILVGAPGVGFDRASQINVDSRVYAMNAPGDPVGRVPIFGENPVDPSFGAVRIDTSAMGGDKAVTGHSDYFDASADNKSDYDQSTTASARHMASIISGHPEKVPVAGPTLPEMAGEVSRGLLLPIELADRGWDKLQDAVDLPQPVDDVVDVGQGVNRAARGLVEWGTEASVDLIQKPFKK